MEEKVLNDVNYVEELVEIIRSSTDNNELLEKLDDYHDNDIAGAIEQLTPEERAVLFPVLGYERVSQIIAYIEEPGEILKEISIESAAKVISQMDSDDAVDILEEMEDETQEQIVQLMDDESSHDVQMILSYDDDEVGSVMTTNYIVIEKDLSIKNAMKDLVNQAGDNDNISTIYVVDKEENFYGVIDLKELIIARQGSPLDDIIVTSYPFVRDHDKIADCLEKLKDYAEDSIPVLDENNKILGVITSLDIVEVIDDEMGDDYAKLAGLTAEEDLHEKTFDSVKKRIPWLIVLLLLGLGVSTVIGVFSDIVALVPIVICFQSLILDMAGNSGTQSLAVTIRVLVDENLTGKQKFAFVLKEVRVGLSNGIILGSVAFIIVGLYIIFIKGMPVQYALLTSGCVGFSLLVAMIVASLIGTMIPIVLKKIKIDPAVASGPLITTVNDFIAVITYYGLSWLLLVNTFHIETLI